MGRHAVTRQLCRKCMTATEGSPCPWESGPLHGCCTECGWCSGCQDYSGNSDDGYWDDEEDG